MRKELCLVRGWRDNIPNHRGYQMRQIKGASACISLLAVSLILAVASCVLAQKGEQKKARTVVEQMDKQAPAKDVNMGYLQFRDKVVMISRGAKGSLYTVKNKDGKVLASKINEKAFKEKYPVLFKQVESGLAGNDATLRKTTIEHPIAHPK
jgi:hypothetical protein